MKKRWNVDREGDQANKYWSSAPLEPKVKCQLCCDRPCQQAPVATSTSNWTQLPSNLIGEHWWQPTTIPRFAPMQARMRGEQTPPLGASRSHLRSASRASASTTGRASLPSLWINNQTKLLQKILNLHQRCVWRDTKSWGEQQRGNRGSFWGRGCRGRSRPRARSTWTSSGRSWRRCTGTRPPPRCCPCGRRRAWWTRSSRTTRTRRGRSWNFKAEGWTAMFSCYQVFHHHPPPPHLHHLRLACRQTQAFPVPLY